jgi:hypothetical protein
MGIESFACSTIQTLNGSYILGVVVKNNLRTKIKGSAHSSCMHMAPIEGGYASRN